MSWEAQFVQQWQTFINTIETRVRREFNSKKKFDLISVNTVIQVEAAKWTMANHYNGAWLEKLGREHPSVAREFQDILTGLRLEEPIPLKSALPLWSSIFGVALIGITFFFLNWFGFPIWKQLLGTGISVAIVISFLRGLASFRKDKVAAAVADRLKEELQTRGNRLSNLLVQADSEEQQNI